MSGLFGGGKPASIVFPPPPAPPPPPKPTPLPDPEDEQARARRAQDIARRRRSGFASTILDGGGETLG